MTAHFSRDTFPAGGWIFFQPQTGWSAPSPKSSTFTQTVQQIIKMRQQNPAMMIRHKWSIDPGAVGQELENFTRLRCGIPLPVPVPSLPGGYSALGASATDIKKVASGAGLLVAWDVSGLPPVDNEVATTRAETCLACPLNSVPKLEQWNTVPVAMSLSSRLKRIEAMKLSTVKDAGLGLCDGLYCPTQKLVHAPMEVISKRLKAGVRESLPANCWILKG